MKSYKDYTDEEKQALKDRWGKPLLDPDTKKPIEVEGCKTFQELLTKRLIEIREVLSPKIAEVDSKQKWWGKRAEYQEIWRKVVKKKFEQLNRDLSKYDLKSKPDLEELTQAKIERIGRNYHIDLRGANLFLGPYGPIVLDGANLCYAHFEGAICHGAFFQGARCWCAYFDRADCSNAYFYGAELHNTHFEDAILNLAQFNEAILSNAHIEGAVCIGVHFDGADCIDAHFDGAICLDTYFDGAKCQKAHFDGAECERASFGTIETIINNRRVPEPCNLSDVTFKGAKFIGVDTSCVDWSKNPAMKRYIEQQQFVHSLKEKFDNWKIFKYIPWAFIYVLDYMSDFIRWAFGIIIIISAFSLLFVLSYEGFKYSTTPEWTSWLYFSVITFSTLGFGDVTPTIPVTHLWVMLEVFSGYFMLGGLITFLANWLGRK